MVELFVYCKHNISGQSKRHSVESESICSLYAVRFHRSGLWPDVGNMLGQRAAKQMLSGDQESSLRITRACLNYRTELLEQAGKNINTTKSEMHALVSEKSKTEGAVDAAVNHDD